MSGRGFLRNLPKISKIRVSIFGFSRGTAEARVFANWLPDACDPPPLRLDTPSEVAAQFAVSATLREAFNAYVAATSAISAPPKT